MIWGYNDETNEKKKILVTVMCDEKFQSEGAILGCVHDPQSADSSSQC